MNTTGRVRYWRDGWVLVVLVLASWGLTSWIGGRHDAADAAALRTLAKQGDIVMLSSATCIYCTQARQWLEAQRIPFRECNIDADRACLKEFQARGAPGTPTFVVRGRTVVGFDRAGLLSAFQS